MTSTWFDPNDPMGGPAPENEELALQRARAQAMRAQAGQQQPQSPAASIDPQAVANIYKKFSDSGGSAAGSGGGTGGGATSASAMGSYAAAIPVFKEFVEWGEDADLGVADQYDFYRETLGDLGNKFGIKDISETLKFWN